LSKALKLKSNQLKAAEEAFEQVLRGEEKVSSSTTIWASCTSGKATISEQQITSRGHSLATKPPAPYIFEPAFCPEQNSKRLANSSKQKSQPREPLARLQLQGLISVGNPSRNRGTVSGALRTLPTGPGIRYQLGMPMKMTAWCHH
jgi:hypothetical protein